MTITQKIKKNPKKQETLLKVFAMYTQNYVDVIDCFLSMYKKRKKRKEKKEVEKVRREN